jgi:hypothetical protein
MIFVKNLFRTGKINFSIMGKSVSEDPIYLFLK